MLLCSGRTVSLCIVSQINFIHRFQTHVTSSSNTATSPAHYKPRPSLLQHHESGGHASEESRRPASLPVSCFPQTNDQSAANSVIRLHNHESSPDELTQNPLCTACPLLRDWLIGWLNDHMVLLSLVETDDLEKHEQPQCLFVCLFVCLFLNCLAT